MRIRTGTSLAGLLAAGALIAAPIAAQEDPYLAEDDSWISIDGTVQEVMPNAFELDYGESYVTVEMDDYDRDADAYSLLEGDRVTVMGRVDDDLFERTTIEAASVYVEEIGSYFFASAADEEDGFITITSPVDISRTVVQGTVSQVSDDEFVVDQGLTRVTVSTEEMAYDPLDDEGYQQIDVGDVVTVTGEIDEDFFTDNEFEAEIITTLVDRRSMSTE